MVTMAKRKETNAHETPGTLTKLESFTRLLSALFCARLDSHLCLHHHEARKYVKPKSGLIAKMAYVEGKEDKYRVMNMI